MLSFESNRIQYDSILNNFFGFLWFWSLKNLVYKICKYGLRYWNIFFIFRLLYFQKSKTLKYQPQEQQRRKHRKHKKSKYIQKMIYQLRYFPLKLQNKNSKRTWNPSLQIEKKNDQERNVAVKNLHQELPQECSMNQVKEAKKLKN